MRRDEALAILRERAVPLREEYGFARLGLFGSVARDEADVDSDVDLVVEMGPDLFKMVHLKEALEEALQARVDLVRYRDRMNRFLKRRIDQEAIYV